MPSSTAYAGAASLLLTFACSSPPHAARSEGFGSQGAAGGDSGAQPAPVASAIGQRALAEGPVDAARDSLAPLEGPALQTWTLGDTEASVVIPVGAREKRPVLVGVHGARDRPEWACEKWRATTAGAAFVVCPKGVAWKRNRNLTWGPPAVLAERAERALTALRERYPTYVAEGPVVYAGFSLGGTLAPAVVAERPQVYDTAILVEAGHTRLDAKIAVGRLKRAGVSRVIVSCATRRCLALAKRMKAAWGDEPGFSFGDGGIGRGHLFDDRMTKTLARALGDAVATDPRWTGIRLHVPEEGEGVGQESHRQRE